MERIAEVELEGGRWAKTEAGYRLEGRSTAPPRPRSLVPWQIAGLLGCIACVVAFAGVLVWHTLRKPRRAGAGRTSGTD